MVAVWRTAWRQRPRDCSLWQQTRWVRGYVAGWRDAGRDFRQ